MRAKAESRLTPRERLARGLTYSAVGPLDVTRGVVGLGVHSAQTTASELRRRYRQGQLARDIAAAQETIARELAAAQEVVTNLPQALQHGAAVATPQQAPVGNRGNRRRGAGRRRGGIQHRPAFIEPRAIARAHPAWTCNHAPELRFNLWSLGESNP